MLIFLFSTIHLAKQMVLPLRKDMSTEGDGGEGGIKENGPISAKTL